MTHGNGGAGRRHSSLISPTSHPHASRRQRFSISAPIQLTMLPSVRKQKEIRLTNAQAFLKLQLRAGVLFPSELRRATSSTRPTAHGRPIPAACWLLPLPWRLGGRLEGTATDPSIRLARAHRTSRGDQTRWCRARDDSDLLRRRRAVMWRRRGHVRARARALAGRVSVSSMSCSVLAGEGDGWWDRC